MRSFFCAMGLLSHTQANTAMIPIGLIDYDYLTAWWCNLQLQLDCYKFHDSRGMHAADDNSVSSLRKRRMHGTDTIATGYIGKCICVITDLEKMLASC